MLICIRTALGSQSESMPSIVKILRVAADPNRLRILLLLRNEELSVAELQEILAMGQSTISTHLSQLKQAKLVEDRRIGKSNLYHLAVHDAEKREESSASGHGATSALPRDLQKQARALAPEQPASAPAASATPAPAPANRTFLDELLDRAAAEIPESAADQAALRRVLHKRQDKMRAFFDSVAGRLGRDYVPGKSWKAMAEALLRLLPPMTIADLGAGEGAFALLLAERAQKVIVVDSSARMIEVGREQAQRNGVQNIEFRIGDMEDLPIAACEVDVAFFSQSLHHALHPQRALHQAARILVPGGRVVILDLLKHRFEEARDLYADEWLGFSEAELETMLRHAGFDSVHTSVVDKEPETPQFQTLLAIGHRPG